MAIKRLHYFDGQFLREQDFNEEQDYHLTMRRMHAHRAHSPGIVDGLDVISGTSQVTVGAGVAIDNLGREIVLTEDQTLPIDGSHVNYFVVIAYQEEETDEKSETGITGSTRWTQDAMLQVVSTIPTGAIGLAQIEAVSGTGEVTLSNYRRTYSAPTIGGDLEVGRDLTVMGNLEVKGDTTLVNTDQMRGDVVLGDEDDDQVTVEGILKTGHSSGKLQVDASVNMTGSLNVQGDLQVQGTSTIVQTEQMLGNVVLGDNDNDIVTVEGTMITGHSSGRLKVNSPVEIDGDLLVSGDVNGRDIAGDGTTLDTHLDSKNNPHATTALQVDTQGGTNRIVNQINAGTGVIADGRIATSIARETRFNPSNGHDHDGANSKKISPTSLAGVSTNVNAANLNLLTAGPTSNAATLHTHPFVPDDESVSMNKLSRTARVRALRTPSLVQNQNYSFTTDYSYYNGIAFDGTYLWVGDQRLMSVLKIDPLTNEVVTKVKIDKIIYSLAFDGGYLWIGGYGLFKLDVATDSVEEIIQTGNFTAVTVNAGYVWAASGNSVRKIDMTTNSIVATVGVGNQPQGLAMVGSFLWVANGGSDSVSKIDVTNNAVVATVSVGSGPSGLAAAAGTFLWVANYNDNSVSKVEEG